MAGAGYKAFADGDVLTAAQVQTYLMDQAVMKFADSSARTSAIGTAVLSEGMVSYLADTDAVEVYDGSSWTSVAPAQVVRQIATAEKTTTQTLSSLAYNTYSDVTGLSIAFTPTAADSRLLITGKVNQARGLGNNFLRVVADSTAIMVGTSVGSRTPAHASGRSDASSIAFDLFINGTYSQGDTSEVTYKIQVAHNYNPSATLYINRNDSDTNNADSYRQYSYFQIIEVAP